MTGTVWHGMSDVMDGNNRFSTWNITWMCCPANPVRLPDRDHFSSNGKQGFGQRAST